MAKYVGKRIVPKHCGYWDNTKPYEMESIVYDRNSGNSYISRKAVPAGTDISQEEYWALCSDFNLQLEFVSQQMEESEQRIRQDNAATEQAIRENNAATERAIREDNTATAQRVNERVASAENALAQQKQAYDNTAEQLNARMDAVLSAGTGDGATEVLDARVDGRGHEYATLGESIRGQAAEQEKERGKLEAKLNRLFVEVRTSNNLLDPTRQDQDTWDVGAYKAHYHSVSPDGMISSLSASDMYSFCGNWDIRGLNLSGKKIVCNKGLRFLSFTKTPLKVGDFRRSAADCIAVLTTSKSAGPGVEVQLPEFDDTVFPYMNFTVQYWDDLALFGGEQILYISDKTPFSVLDVDEYAAEVTAPNGIVIDNVAQQIRDYELVPEKMAFMREVRSTNIYDHAKYGLYPMWLNGATWEVNPYYYVTDYIPIPKSRKIITNFQFRGLTAFTSDDANEYTRNPVAGQRSIPITVTSSGSQTQGAPGQVYDLSGFDEKYKYVRLWIYITRISAQDEIGWYVADAENYKESLWEEYFEPYFLLKSEYIPGFRTSELVDDVGFVKAGDPVSALKNDMGFLTEAYEKMTISPANSDRIMLLGDSYTESSFSVRGKAYINKLSLFSDYVFENMALSGDIYYGNIDRIRTEAQQYGLSFEEARPKFAMLCCFTNDIKTLTADQYADALRRTCEELIGRGVQPIICTEYHASHIVPSIVSVNEQVAKEYGCPCWDIASIVQIIRGGDYAPYWGGSHAGTRSNALQSDNYEKFLEGLERPNHSMKLFRLRDSYEGTALDDLVFHTNEERAKLFREICVGHTRLADPTQVDNCTNGRTTRENSEYAKLMKGSAVSFPKVALASVVIPGDYRSTKSLALTVNADKAVRVYVKDIAAGNYVRPRRYVRFDFTSAVTNIPAVGDVYRCTDFGTSNLTVTEVVMGQADGDAIGYILCSGVSGNGSFNDNGGTLTKQSGSGDVTISFTYKSVGYRADDLNDQKLGGWTELQKNGDAYPLPEALLSRAIFRDRVDFLIVADSAFNLTGVQADWYGSERKIYTRHNVQFLSNLARDSEEWILQPSFGTAGERDSFWGVIPSTVSDACYPYGCNSVAEVDVENGIAILLDADKMKLHDKYRSGTAILEVWARYFPEEYTDGSGDQITEDSYDYAVLKAEIGRENNKGSYVTLKERVNTHWKIIQFPIALTGGMAAGGFHLKLYSDKPLQIAKVSLKKE